MDSGRGFGSLSLRVVARCAGIVPTGFYRHFEDMDALGLALMPRSGKPSAKPSARCATTSSKWAG